MKALIYAYDPIFGKETALVQTPFFPKNIKTKEDVQKAHKWARAQGFIGYYRGYRLHPQRESHYAKWYLKSQQFKEDQKKASYWCISYFKEQPNSLYEIGCEGILKLIKVKWYSL